MEYKFQLYIELGQMAHRHPKIKTTMCHISRIYDLNHNNIDYVTFPRHRNVNEFLKKVKKYREMATDVYMSLRPREGLGRMQNMIDFIQRTKNITPNHIKSYQSRVSQLCNDLKALSKKSLSVAHLIQELKDIGDINYEGPNTNPLECAIIFNQAAVAAILKCGGKARHETWPILLKHGTLSLIKELVPKSSCGPFSLKIQDYKVMNPINNDTWKIVLENVELDPLGLLEYIECDIDRVTCNMYLSDYKYYRPDIKLWNYLESYGKYPFAKSGNPMLKIIHRLETPEYMRCFIRMYMQCPDKYIENVKKGICRNATSLDIIEMFIDPHDPYAYGALNNDNVDPSDVLNWIGCYDLVEIIGSVDEEYAMKRFDYFMSIGPGNFAAEYLKIRRWSGIVGWIKTLLRGAKGCTIDRPILAEMFMHNARKVDCEFIDLCVGAGVNMGPLKHMVHNWVWPIKVALKNPNISVITRLLEYRVTIPHSIFNYIYFKPFEDLFFTHGYCKFRGHLEWDSSVRTLKYIVQDHLKRHSNRLLMIRNDYIKETTNIK